MYMFHPPPPPLFPSIISVQITLWIAPTVGKLPNRCYKPDFSWLFLMVISRSTCSICCEGVQSHASWGMFYRSSVATGSDRFDLFCQPASQLVTASCYCCSCSQVWKIWLWYALSHGAPHWKCSSLQEFFLPNYDLFSLNICFPVITCAYNVL